MKYVTLITIEEIYASALKGKLVRSAEGWERVEPVVPRENPTASPIINAIARALRERVFQNEHALAHYERVFQNEHALAHYLEADIASLNGATRILMGITLRQLYRAYMNMRAQELLARTDLPIEEVAHRCGCPFQSSFSRGFKTRNGIYPTEYRQAHRPADYARLYRWE